jgi:signal transduction histidine kinase
VSPRAARIVSRVLLAVAIVVTVATVPLAFTASGVEPNRIVAVGDESTPSMSSVREELEGRVAAGDDLVVDSNLINALASLLFSLLWVGTGTLIVSRQPTNRAGWLFCAVGLVLPLAGFALALTIYGVKASPGAVPALGLWALVGEYVFVLVALIPLLFLLFPDGRPPSPRWRWALRALFAGVGLALLGFLLSPGPLNNYVDAGILYENPIGAESLAAATGVVTAVGTILAIIAGLSTIVALAQRFRRSSGEERQKLRWLAFVGGVAGALFALMWLAAPVSLALGAGADLFLFPILFGAVGLTILIGVPAAYLIAIFRYGLWQLDVVVKKAVLYGTLVISILALGAILILGVGGLVVGGPAGVDWVLVVAGVVIGLLFLPLRRLAIRVADRLVYGKRSTPYQVLAAFSGRVAGTYSTEDVLPRMAELLATGVGANVARIWLRLGDKLVPEASWPEGSPASPVPISGDVPPEIRGEESFEVRDRGEHLGALSVSMPASDPMNPSKAKLVQDLAAQAGLVLRNVRLIEDLRASRQRIVAAQDQERRKLERNIHDGAQQQMVALSVKLALVRAMAKKDVDRADSMLGELQAEAKDAMENLRDLARGIYPPLLADQGLVAALDAQARKAPLPVTVEANGIGRYPQEAEAAVYFCVLEALQNVAKYAGASTVSVRLSATNGRLTFSVTDDGAGFDPEATSRGAGLTNMADRLAALGGDVRIQSEPGRGTTVTGRVPVKLEPVR